jgi:poly-beta-1,6-N-acetyl-D-glucosamine synthase
VTEAAFFIFAASSIFYVIHFGLYLVGANLYDVWQFRRKHRLFMVQNASPLPLVTVAIAAHNEEPTIIRCLTSIARSRYPLLQIVVVDDGSTDHTALLARRYKRDHPELDMKIVRLRRNVGKGAALNYGLRRYAKGKLAMTLDADSAIRPDTIRNAVSYFDDPTIAGVAANVKILDEEKETLIGWLQRFEHMVGYRSKKTYSLANCEFVVGGVASTYRMDVLRRVGFYDTDTLTEDIGLSMKVITKSGNRAHRLVYGADVVAYTEAVTSFKALLRQRYRWKYGSMQNIVKHYYLIGLGSTKFTPALTIYRMPIAVISEVLLLFAPIIWAYNIAFMLYFNYIWLLVGAYLTITLYTLVVLWWDEHTPFKKRLYFSACLPMIYFMYYIMDVVQFIAVIACVGKSHSLLTRRPTGSTWTSPERIGSDIVVE